MKIKVLIVDDHQLFREGLANLLSESDDIEIAGQAEDGEDAIERVQSLHPDVVLMDIAMPVINGIEATQIIREEFPEVNVIAISMHSDRQYIKPMLAAGALGYLFKNCSYNQLIDAIKQVYKGHKYLSEEITNNIISDYIDGKNDDDPLKDLSNREKEVLTLFAQGYSTRIIADRLFVSVKTISTHKQNIFEKLNFKSDADLIKFAIKANIIDL